MAVLLPAATYFFSQMITYFRANRVRTQLLSDAVACRNTIRLALQQGSAKTLSIDTWLNAPPYSHAVFQSSSGGTNYDFALVNNTVYMTAGSQAQRPIASNVSSLNFVVPDPAVPTQVLVTLRLSAPIDSQHTANVTLPDQLVVMQP